MPKNYQLSDFVSFKKSGKLRYELHCTPRQEADIYRWLKEQGFGLSEADERVFTFRRIGGEIMPASVISMKRNFLAFLEAAAFESNDGDEPKRSELINWFFSMPPLKQNELFRLHLKDTLSPEEMSRIQAA
ncbi:hypothetical protein D0C36_20255 [Mucilaginibacter conchicola]|uniref:Uncharacterized protein n=1 Tax=Mucilaginibacter conchicola TaxID=2303333 RepID=A0A372NRP1_9SPHI|nr:hypothetical protein [Mucilaginibacter conchicola]RFZ91267.1 hypothetical protein D0C36_20255 [Mucilaginibacter conchicola]